MPSLQLLLAVAVPLVAVASVLSTQAISRRSLAHQRRLSDLDAARDLFDHAAPMLQDTMELVITLTQGARAFGPELFAIPALGASFDHLERASRELRALSLRVDIRLGPAHPSGQSLEMMCGAVEHILGGLRGSRLGLALTAERQARNQREIQEATKQYFRHMAIYIVSAHQTVGSKLRGVDPSLIEDSRSRWRRPRPLRRLRWALVDHVPLPAAAIRRLEGDYFQPL